MDGSILVAAQLSSLFPASQVTSFIVHTSRQNTPLPSAQSETDLLAEHASFSTLLHTPITGTIILRVLHGGLVLELISLSTDLSPIRFVFPAAILPTPAIFLWGTHELHVLAVTDIGSLYRLVLPFGHQPWQDQVRGNWCREYIIKNITGSVSGLVQVQGTHCVAIGLPSGSLLRLETELLGDDSNCDDWTESLSQHNSFLHSLTSFLPSLYGSTSEGSEIISMASHPWPTDIGHIWTLSRDRTLRLWKAKIGCVSAKTLSSTITGRATTPSPGTPASDVKLRTLLEPGQQALLRIFTTNSQEEHIYVLAFNPTPSSPTSGGFFLLFDTVSDQLYELRTIECSKSSAYCHLQDFMVSGHQLYTLWERQGRSTVEIATINPAESHQQDSGNVIWEATSYAHESELTPAYLEELFISPGSMTDKFLEAVMRPGIFSTLTLRTAIDQYTDSCLSLPGLPPPQLLTAYNSLGENIAAVVGATVHLLRDPHTGALQHDNYQNALKRDWEGFIARCREIERNARWPLVLGAEEDGNIIVVERERVASLVREDLALVVHRRLASSIESESQNSILELSWMLRTQLGPRSMLNMESRLIKIMHQEIALSFVDILQDESRRFNFRDELDEGLENWIIGRLHSIGDIDQSIRTALDIVGGFDMEIKREEDEVELLLPLPRSEWRRAITAAYISTSVEARYELCLSTFTILFFLSEELLWDQSLLAEVFAVFRGIAMLRFISKQLAGDSSGEKPPLAITAADDVVARMRNMHVSRDRGHFTPTYSLIHRLLAQSGDIHEPPGAAHRFLDSTGLLQSTSPAHATKFEVSFCERLRLLGYYHVARDMLFWLPKTPGVTYVLGRLWLSMGRADDASVLFEKLSGSFGPDNALLPEDEEALAAVLPGAELFDSDFSFYLHASALFKSVAQIRHEVLFSQLALSVAPENIDCTALWQSVIRGNTDLGLYDDAYASLIATPYDKQKRECVSHLVYRMCEDNAVEKFMTFNFAGIADEVEDCLSFKARNVDPRVRPLYSRILYSWYVFRGDYRNAALIIYQRARKLHDLSGDPSFLVSLAAEQLEAYLLAMNCLSLTDPKSAWVVIPIISESGREPRKRRKLSKHIPDSKYAEGKHDAEIVDLADIQYEHALLSAQLELLQKDPTMHSLSELPPSFLVLKLAQSNRFNMAMATARSLNVDMTDLFTHLTGQCLRLSRDPDAVIQEDSSDWLLTDKVSSWPGTTAEKGWRYLRQSLERHDNMETDYKYTKVAFETIIAFERSSLPPPWLVHSLEEYHPEYLIRACLRYEALQLALEYTLSLIRNAGSQLARDPPKNSFSTWLPYTLIDEVLMVATTQDGLSPRCQVLRQELQTAINNRVKRMQKLSQFPR